MNKYIDVEKLKEKIDKVRQDWLGDSTGLEVGEVGAELGAAESILDSLDNIITSLQQEQPELPDNLDEAAEKGFEDYINSNFLDIDTIWAKMPLTKKFGTYMFRAGAGWTARQMKPEQPEVDLEKEIEEYFPESDFYTGWNFDDVVDIARHFWNKGYNARK